MSYRLDEVDKRILYRLVEDARNTSAPMIAEEVNVSPGTIRNRISQLEDAGILRGYHANIDYERAESRLKNLFICTSPVPDRERHTKQAAEIPGVIGVRQLMTGRRNIHVTAVGDDMRQLNRVANNLSDLGLKIEEENLVQDEEVRPYHKFGPNGAQETQSIADFMQLSAGAQIVELSVAADSEIAGLSLSEANKEGLLSADTLVISIEREDTILTPRGDSIIQPDDLITLFCRGGLDEETLSQFGSNPRGEESTPA